MIDDAERFDAAYEALVRAPETDLSDPFAGLLSLAVEVGTALRRRPLSGAERARLYERAVALAELRAQRGWRERVHVDRRSAVVGGAALMTALAAVGVALVRERRHHGLGIAA
ncbi:MAG: hypothetical protein NVSMB29_01040 [Candidatus Dormibacteria bacterium]